MVLHHSWKTFGGILVVFFIFIPLVILSKILGYVFEIVHWLLLMIKGKKPDPKNCVMIRRIWWHYQAGRQFSRQISGPAELSNLHFPSTRWEDTVNFIWLDPDVHLVHISSKGAEFMRTKKGMNVFHSTTSAFANLGIQDFAEEFAVIPIHQFRHFGTRLLENLKKTLENDKEKRVVIMSSTARCGGSLIVQHFEDLDGCIVMNEPGIFNSLFMSTSEPTSATPMLFQIPFSSLPSSEMSSLLKLVLLFVCKYLFCSPNISTVAIKINNSTPWMIKAIMDLRNEMPFRMSFLYAYRNPKPSFESWLKFVTEFACDGAGLVGEIPLLRTIFPDFLTGAIGRLIPIYPVAGLKWLIGNEAEWQRRFGWIDKLDFFELDKDLVTSRWYGDARIGKTSLMAQFFIFWLTAILTLKELNGKAEYKDLIFPIAYEDLLADPEMWVKSILPHCGLEPSVVKSTVATAMNKDSQKQSKFSRERMKKHATILSPADVAKLDVVMREADLSESLATFKLSF